MKKIKFLLVCLCITAMCFTTLCGCKTSQSTATPDEEAVTTTVSVTETKAPAETESSAVTETETTATEKEDNNSDVYGEFVDNAVNADPYKPGTCTITLESGEFTANVGDVVTYTYYLKTPKKIENVQATMNYSGRSLKILNKAITADPEKDLPDDLYDDLEKAFPVLGDSVVYNGSNQNLLKFNATSVSGYDFTKGGYLITIEFEVISEISGYISTAVEMMDEVGGKPYVDKFAFVKDVVHKESLSN